MFCNSTITDLFLFVFTQLILHYRIISTYVYKIGLVSGDYSYSTAVGLFNALINIILLIAVNKVVKRINDGQGL